MEYYNYIKALHLIFVITWFAGLFYIPRLFIYHIEADKEPEPDRTILISRFKIMTRRLWFIITWPSAILASSFAFLLLLINPGWLKMDWMLVKLGFVFLLYIYHGVCHHIYKQLQRDRITWSSDRMRLWNEGSTMILFSIIFLVMVRDAVNWIYGVIGLVILAGLLMFGIRLYKHLRSRNKDM